MGNRGFRSFPVGNMNKETSGINEVLLRITNDSVDVM